MKKYLCLLFVVSALTGCKAILKKSYGIKNPKIETEASVKNYLKKNEISAQNLLIFKSLQSWSDARQQKLLTIPDAMFYNAKGEFVTYKKTAADCNAKIDGFIADLKELNNLPSDKARTFGDLSKLLTDYNNNTIAPEKGYDGYVFITWCIYIGKLNRDKAFDWVNLLNKANANGLKIKYYLVNVDFQDSWELTPEERKDLEETKI